MRYIKYHFPDQSLVTSFEYKYISIITIKFKRNQSIKDTTNLTYLFTFK